MSCDERVLLLAPVGRDARLMRELLGEARIDAEICSDGEDLCAQLEAGVGVAVVAEEALSPAVMQRLGEVFDRQPAWSDCPLIVTTLGGSHSRASVVTLQALERFRNITFLDRPIRVMTLISTVRAALAGRRRQYQVRDLLEREQAASRLKDEFLATVSHELRTPLNVILGYSEILAFQECGSDDFHEAVQAIHRNAKVQAELINDLLDVSRIVTGKIHLERRPVDLGRAVDDTMDSLRLAASAKGIAVRLRFDAGPCMLVGDQTRVQQIIWNLLSNAIKFSRDGGAIDVVLTRAKGELTLVVADDGDGIEPEFLPHVFEKFRQQDGSATRKHGGLGLGLSIVRHLVELHGGTVRVESDGKGRGARFSVVLPSLKGGGLGRTAADAPDPEAPQSERLRGVEILVVDDRVDNRVLLRAFLKRLGAHVREADSAAAAYEELRVNGAQLMICDISMPEEDGLSFIRRLRGDGDPRLAALPAVALTAHAAEHDHRHALAAGFDAHLAKPIALDDLRRTLAEILGARMQGPR